MGLMRQPFISCFDISSVVGVAYGRAGGRASLESWDLRAAKERPNRLVLFDEMIERHFLDHRPDLVFHEKPLPLAVMLAIGANEGTVQMLRSLVGTLEQACARHQIPVAAWEVQRARQAVLGRGRWPRGQAKAGVMAGIKLLGYRPATDHEADAVCGFLYQSAMLNPRWAAVQGPLFARAG